MRESTNCVSERKEIQQVNLEYIETRSQKKAHIYISLFEVEYNI